ncbi:MAG: pyridoxal-phosphate dependent enzyme [Spirochaetes bacterium]|nr:pyridoxal-phosphate dependent enzyme [Spirochaetota bacterium]
MARRTPLMQTLPLATEAGAAGVHLKLECLQNTGAFKVRGASNRILSLSEEDRARGVITFSTGNHGKAVSYVAGRLGIPAVVCVSEHVPRYRVDRIRALGAEVVVSGDSQDEAEVEYERIKNDRDMIPVVPFDDPYVVAGQGTIGLEMMSDEPALDAILVPLSGGGLLAGVALAAKLIKPEVRVIGVSISQSPAMLRSVEAGRPVTVEEKDTLADSLLGGIGMENHYTLPVIEEFVDEHVEIDEPEIEAAMYYALSEHSLVIEGGAAVGIAALQTGKVKVEGARAGIVVSGSSVELSQYLAVMQKFV